MDANEIQQLFQELGVVSQGHFECGWLWKVFQRPDHCRIRVGNLESQSVSGLLSEIIQFGLIAQSKNAFNL